MFRKVAAAVVVTSILVIWILSSGSHGAVPGVPVPAAEGKGEGGAAPSGPLHNKPERVAWFQDLSLGMFVHWSADSQLGAVISHSLVGSSDDYARRYFEELPRTFNPKKFDPDAIAALAKLAGMRYVVFTTRHHSGFCMWDTATTDFSVAHTPYAKDVTAELVRALRKQGVAVGFYFSPDDFHFLWKQGKPISRDKVHNVLPLENPPLLEHDKAQLRELLTRYGPIDVLFLDGPIVGRQDEGLRDFCWGLQPDLVITRGAMDTPEQEIPGKPLKGPWEACFTLGTAWQWQPEDTYKSGPQLVSMFVETRAKGGNLLLNIGPRPDGSLVSEQEDRVRELALWNFVNREAVFGTVPWVVTNEGKVWFTKAKDADTVYAIVTADPRAGEPWAFGARKTITLKSVRATGQTKIEVLGQSGAVVEYQPTTDAKATWTHDEEGLHVSAVRAQRLWDNWSWPFPVVLKVTHAQSPTKAKE
jgi:alpha-L-fucosidase